MPDLSERRLLADGFGAAFVLPGGEIDWWCERFDATPVFWSLLDPAGSASRFIETEPVNCAGAPAGPTTHTTLRTSSGLTPSGLIEVRDGLVERRLIRMCRALDGPVTVVHEARFGGFDGAAIDGPFRTELDVRDGQWTAIELSSRGVRSIEANEALARFDHAERVARDESRGAVAKNHSLRVRDAMAVVSACTFRRTGATVAAPTTSLPEAAGGDRQFDYRYAWLRDGSLAASVAASSGRKDVAARHLTFIEHLGPRLFEAPLFTVDGGSVPDEREVPNVRGWEDSRPVRVGNDAKQQIQYDSLGFVADAVSTYVREGGRLSRGLWRLVVELADRCAAPGEEKTGGIWEFRHPRPLLSADIGRWIALDRAIRLARRRRPLARRRHWKAARRGCKDRVLAELRDDGRLPQSFGGDPDEADASALLVPIYGMLKPDDPRAHALVDAHLSALSDGAFVYRYRTGDNDFDGEEGAFVPCCWWAVSALAALGRVDDAKARSDELCRRLPQLLPEEFDPAYDASLGNLPLVWSHAELVRAMNVLESAEARARYAPALERTRRWLVRARSPRQRAQDRR